MTDSVFFQKTFLKIMFYKQQNKWCMVSTDLPLFCTYTLYFHSTHSSIPKSPPTTSSRTDTAVVVSANYVYKASQQSRSQRRFSLEGIRLCCLLHHLPTFTKPTRTLLSSFQSCLFLS